MSRIRFTTEKLPIGSDEVPLLVGRDGDEPKTVFLSYQSFLEVAAALYTAIETLKVLGVDPAAVLAEDGDVVQLHQTGPAVPRHAG